MCPRTCGTFVSRSIRRPPATPVDRAKLQELEDVTGLPDRARQALLGVLAAATLLHTLLSSVRRRRHELAVLEALGFVRRQVWTHVAVGDGRPWCRWRCSSVFRSARSSAFRVERVRGRPRRVGRTADRVGPAALTIRSRPHATARTWWRPFRRGSPRVRAGVGASGISGDSGEWLTSARCAGSRGRS